MPQGVAGRPRIVALDTLRGFTILSMVAFHAVYDLAYIYGIDLAWFTSGPVQEAWRVSISWTFLALAGWMCALSRNNLRRGAVYAVAAVAVWVVTTLAAVDTPVNFGILFCMAGSTLIWAAAERTAPRLLDRLPLVPTCATLIVLFTLTRGIPLQRYPIEGLAWLGFPSPAFASGDYYPLLPFSLLYLVAAFTSRRFKRTQRSYPAWMMRDWCPPLTTLGRLSLSIYLMHQPVVLLAFQMLLG